MSQTGTILVVDDEPEIVTLLKFILEKDGHRILEAGNGMVALERLGVEPPSPEAPKPDLIILDIMMPVMDGYSCLRELNARYGRAHFPVIILTARDRMKDLFALEGIEDYVVKPFDHEDLLIRIERAFKRRAVDEAAASQPPPPVKAA